MFIIPMAGLSSRFFKAGFNIPKYQLTLGNESVFSWSVKSFIRYFNTDRFVFIYRDIFNTYDFILSEILSLNIKNYDLILLDNPTLGQADTVYQGVSKLRCDDEIFIFNIDSKIDNFLKPTWRKNCDGYLEVFKGKGDNWSFVKPKNDFEVLETAEKDRISDLCSDGLYYFKNVEIFTQLFKEVSSKSDKTKGEYYIAPLYNYLIRDKRKVFYDVIDASRLKFCGTPAEYDSLLKEIAS